MNSELLSSLIDVIFGDFMPYIAPLLFLLIVFMFANRIIDLIYYAFEIRRGH